jgi:rhomboid family GlyGly-CTERM serine protease
LRAGRTHGFFFAGLAGLTAALALAPPAVVAGLAYDRSRIVRGQVWRLLGTHVAHAGPAHAVWNLAGLALVWMAFGRRLGAKAWLLAGCACALGSTLGPLAFDPEVRFMLGLSGVLHGLLAAGSVVEVREHGRLGWLVLAAVALKLAWEQLDGSATRAALGAPIAAASHLYGALTGVAAGLALPRADGARGRRPGPAPSSGDSGRAAGAPRR